MNFYEMGMIVDFVKGELERNPIPKCRAWKEGMGTIEGNLYIVGNRLMKATQTVSANGDGTYNNGKPAPIHDNNEFLTDIRDFHWGDYIPGVTIRYKSKTKTWNRLDHWMLGMYLRWQRDLFGQDWMYGYNCWDGEYLNYSINKGEYIDRSDGVVVLTVPIIAGQEYTLWGDSPTGALLAVGYSDKGELLNKSYRKVGQLGLLRRNQPYVINLSTLGLDKTYDGINEYLTLFVQVPTTSSGIFVMEGNYADIGKLAFGGDMRRGIMTSIENLPNLSIACLDRVVEGLSGNIINGQQFSKSIAWMQKVLSSIEWKERVGFRYEGTVKEGLWDDNFQQWVLNKFKNPLVVNGREMPGIQDFDGEGVKELEHRIREVMGYAV